MKMKHSTIVMIWLLLLLAIAGATEVVVEGVFGLAPVTEETKFVVWIPLDNDESISGVMWYNNDGSKAFPEILAVAGDAENPAVLENAVVVGENVHGVTMGWSEFTFDQAIASATPGLFLVFHLPLDGAFVSEGVGSGLGYVVGDGQVRCWVSTEAGEWNSIIPECQMAVSPVINANKSGDVLVLGLDGESSQEGVEDREVPIPLLNRLLIAPNPFNPKTEISFGLPARSEVELSIFDVRGRKVQSLVSSTLESGLHTVSWNGRDGRGRGMSSGVYFALLETNSLRLTKRLTLIR